jgi:hypothetical protein
MAKRCNVGIHRWHFNGLVWICRNGCGSWRKSGEPEYVVRDRNDPAVIAGRALQNSAKGAKS